MTTHLRTAALFFVATLAACGDSSLVNSGSDPADPNTAPVIGGDPITTIEAGQLYMFAPTASDADGNALTFTVTNAPSWSRFNGTTGLLSGIPSDADVASYHSVVIAVSDGLGGTDSLPPFSITVTPKNVDPINADPVIAGNPVTTVEAGQSYVFAPTASDPDGDTLTFTIANRPSWAGFDSTTGTLSGTPSDTDVGTYDGIVIAVDDGRGGSASLQAFSIAVTPGNVTPTNTNPVIGGNPVTIVEAGQPYVFAPTASDADGDTLTFTVTNRPSWAGFDSATGTLAGTPSNADVGTYGNIVIAVSDGRGGTAALTAFSIAVEQPNTAPVIAGAPATTVEAGQPYAFRPTASDADGDTLTFTADNRPSWASFDTATGILSGTPSDSDVGTYNGIVIGVDDNRGGAASLPAFSITVQRANADPVIYGGPATTIRAGQPYAFKPTASDPDGDTLTFAVTNAPSWTRFDTATGFLSGTPSDTDIGTYDGIVIAVDDGRGGTDSLPAFSITVEQANGEPTIAGDPITTVRARQLYLFAPTASDPDGDELGFIIANAPSWTSFDTATGILSGTPLVADIGTYANIVITVRDEFGGTAALPAFSISVEQPNADPVIAGDPIATVRAGQPYLFTPTASDADGDTLTFSVTSPPSWAAFDTATGVLSGTPSDTDIGTYTDIVIAVDDGFGGTASLPAFSITVEQANVDPVIAGDPATTIEVGQLYTFVPTASDANGDTLTFTVANRPSWTSFDTATGRLYGTPEDTDVGTYAGIVMTVSDGRGGTDSLPPFSIAVEPANVEPVISGDPVTAVRADQPYVFTPTASDADGDTLTFTVTNAPSWAAFDTATGTLSGTPSAADVRTHENIVVAVSDGRGGTASLPAFSITVEQANVDPVISGDPATTIDAGQRYTFAPTASDPDGDTLTFTVTNAPPWAAFDTATGTLSGTPSDADIGIHGSIVIAVSDGFGGTASLPVFSITVEQANGDPVIAGNPATAIDAGRRYTFVPTASDPENDTLTFSVANAPSWAAFDSTSGTLSGIPSDADAGTDANIVITVSDGFGGTASLPAFSIIVVDTPVANGATVAGGYAYVADDDNGLLVMDVADPTNPVTVGGVATPGWALGVTVADGYAYVADGPPGLHVVDVSDPTNPVIVASLDTPGQVYGVTVLNGYAYVADGSQGLQIVNVSDPDSPQIVGSRGMPAGALGVTVADVIADVYVYVAGGYAGLQVVNVSEPDSPVVVASLDTQGSARSVAVAGGHAYVADDNAGLQVVDVSSPDNPSIVTGVDLPGWAESVTVVGGRAYVTDLVGLQVLDVSDPANPALSGSVDTPGKAQGVTVADGYAYVADDYAGLQVVATDAVNPATRAGPLAGADTPGWARDVAAANGYAYVADESGGLQVVNVSDPANPSIAGSLATGGWAESVAIAGAYAYMADGASGLQVVDVSDPANPSIAGNVATPGWAQSVTVSGSYAYVTDDSPGLLVMDVSDPANPVIVSSANTVGSVRSVAVAGNYAYLAGGYNGGLQVVDVSDPTSPFITGFVVPPTWSYDVAVAGNYAYVADGTQGGLQVVDVSDPGSPVVVGSVDTPHEARGVTVSGGYAYVADAYAGLYVVDVSDPANPAIVATADTPGSALAVVVIGGYAYVADAESGLQVIDLTAF